MSHWSEDLVSIEQARTLDGLFHQRVKRSPERIAYRWFDRERNDWQTLSWREAGEQVSRWRSALAAEGLAVGDRVAILLRNCPEWLLFDQAALSLGLVTVPLYTDDRADSAAYILADAAVKLLLIQDAGRWKRLAPVIGDAPWPQRVVILDGRETTGEATRHAAAATDPRVVIARDWLPAPGAPAPQRNADGDALATIVYTSGTTGRPKGVMLSHRNILSNAHGALTLIDVYQQDEFLSFLPLSHMLERTGSYYLPMMAGATVAFARSVGQLGEDLQTIRPSVMIAVPRVFERVHQRIADQLAARPAPVRWLFALAVKVGGMQFERAQGRRGWHPLLLLWPLLRRKVARPVMDKLGGRMRAAVSGGAPLPPEVARVFIGLGLPLLQGYGLTETSPVIAVNPLEDNRPQSVGVLLRGIQARIGADDELQVKGPGNMLGYWNNHAATAKVLDAEGWFSTGDQARIDGRHLYITGRIKDILVLSNGEKVPPADMEMAIALDPVFEQVLVVGEGRSYLTALAVLNSDLWPGLAVEYGLDPGRAESLRASDLIKDMLRRIRDALADFPGYAKVRRVTLTLEPWSVENGLMTPTMKVKRNAVLARYQDALEAMYADPL
ncbi:long-chain fatty acid--CoA ligase [Thiohalocapsa marina]|uniref:Long-chain fatty acid--CoA ligase n=1 Tax=Thiohalocapsa marina TaxID=424902 RepID=A0A5M8FLN2_9GAMM|nr:long-chain fatty acid--CoA ligase [Thiohalocapsa marina]KAA6185404.1 long-chain fatty acid--CoA ligase [Thiohalocapsa marina]